MLITNKEKLLKLLNILKDFKDVFFEEEVNILALNKYTDYIILLMEGKESFYSILYNLFLRKLSILCEYLEDVL